jgi:hypothetical protein
MLKENSHTKEGEEKKEVKKGNTAYVLSIRE